MIQILLVGAGQIGSRHLQALALLKAPCHITVVDPSENALSVAKARYLQVQNLHSNSSFVSEMPRGKSYALAIIATHAKDRFEAFNLILKDNKVGNIIFEKVLFQSISQIKQTAALLEQNDIRAWVNCPRRAIDGYKRLKQEIKQQLPFSVKVEGSNYGLACNAIHFIDLFAYFVGKANIDSLSHDLSDNFVAAKRLGCYEVFGTIHAKAGQNTLSLHCDNSGEKVSLKVEIKSSQRCYVIDEINQKLDIFDTTGALIESSEFVIPPQSQMSHLVVDDILTAGKCGLAEYAESASLHQHLINSLLDYFNSFGSNDYTSCPIS